MFSIVLGDTLTIGFYTNIFYLNLKLRNVIFTLLLLAYGKYEDGIISKSCFHFVYLQRLKSKCDIRFEWVALFMKKLNTFFTIAH